MVTAAKAPTFVLTDVFTKNAKAYHEGKRRAFNEGGTYSSKTFSILQILLILAQSAKEPLLISVVSESLPHLKRGCIKDTFKLLGETSEDPRWSKTEFTYNFGKGVMEYFGADDASKVRGPRRDILYLNEANNIPWETARGLDIRTSKFTYCDWNPVGRFWAHDFWVDQPENQYIHSTYLDALKVIPQAVIDNIESYKDKDPNWWNIYGLGLVGKVEGLVYPKFEQVDDLPQGEVFYGLDFGYLVDPTALVANVIIGDKLYSKELMYQNGLTNDQIARQMDLLGVRRNSEVWADADEPKSIEELCQMGFNVKPGVKGAGSVEYSHQKVNQYYQHWTKDSLNAIDEQRNFKYLKDKDGNWGNNTTHRWSHCMSARRYAVSGYVPFSSGNRPKTRMATYRFGG